MPAINGIDVQRDPALVGSKFAYHCGNVILVSPAMFDLLAGAESQDELRMLLQNIRIKRGPDLSQCRKTFYSIPLVSPFGVGYTYPYRSNNSTGQTGENDERDHHDDRSPEV